MLEIERADIMLKIREDVEFKRIREVWHKTIKML